MKTFILHPDQTRDRIRANLFAEIDALPQKRFKVQISEDRRQRSQRQNATLWGVIYPPIMEHMGLRGEKDKEDLHEFWCGEYFGWRKTEIMGRETQRPIRTTTTNEDGRRDTLSTGGFMDFCEFIKQRMSDYGIQIPDPSQLSGEGL